jgi:hypothetical protein
MEKYIESYDFKKDFKELIKIMNDLVMEFKAFNSEIRLKRTLRK